MPLMGAARIPNNTTTVGRPTGAPIPVEEDARERVGDVRQRVGEVARQAVKYYNY